MNIQLTPEQQKRADTLAKMTPPEWDAVCKKCGVCCLAKAEICMSDNPDIMDADMRVFYFKRCCDKFDIKTHQCSIFKTRLEQPNCVKLDMNIVLNTKILPASCGYIEYIFGPAQFPANVDFNEVCPIDDTETPSTEQLVKDVIPESFLWSKRCR